ncbi:MAG: hypothetical protein ACC661_05940 [Verrucomicrobiales bacterium]
MRPILGPILIAACLAWLALGVSCQRLPWEDPILPPEPGSAEWNERVEFRVVTADSVGHGPDLGGPEWTRAVDRELGISEKTDDLPGSDAWLQAVDAKLFVD